MLVFNKHWMICKNGKNVARVIIKRSDMKYAENPRKSDETPECTICLWSGYEPLSDWPQNQAADLKHEMRSMNFVRLFLAAPSMNAMLPWRWVCR